MCTSEKSNYLLSFCCLYGILVCDVCVIKIFIIFLVQVCGKMFTPQQRLWIVDQYSRINLFKRANGVYQSKFPTVVPPNKSLMSWVAQTFWEEGLDDWNIIYEFLLITAEKKSPMEKNRRKSIRSLQHLSSIKSEINRIAKIICKHNGNIQSSPLQDFEKYIQEIGQFFLSTF